MYHCGFYKSCTFLLHCSKKKVFSLFLFISVNFCLYLNSYLKTLHIRLQFSLSKILELRRHIIVQCNGLNKMYSKDNHVLIDVRNGPTSVGHCSWERTNMLIPAAAKSILI